MIRYNTVQNRYIYKPEDIETILDTIQNGNFYNEDNCTQENVSNFVQTVNDFIEHLEIVKENVEVERHETEEEAREYFGEDFIKKFEELLTKLDKEETIVALHGTNVGVCPNICEQGLFYKTPSLVSTAVEQSMAYGEHEMHFGSYESILNWGHKNYKGLVIIALPYECFYKEGLWNHFQDTGTSFYGGQDYKIDPDFIAGYIDVTNKQIVLNPKYNRNHNYTGYVKDNELFKEQKNMNNALLKQAIIDAERKLEDTSYEYTKPTEEREIDVTRIPYIIEEMIGVFNSIKLGFPDGMTESRYKLFLEELSYGFNDIAKAIPLLKTNEEVEKEQMERFAMFDTPSSPIISDDTSFDDDIEWDIPEEDKDKFL